MDLDRDEMAVGLAALTQERAGVDAEDAEVGQARSRLTQSSKNQARFFWETCSSVCWKACGSSSLRGLRRVAVA